jgi:CRP/FNR family transcriptional regulator, cyclic AMP receptor protein
VPLSGIVTFQGMSPEHRNLLTIGGAILEPRDGAVVFHQGEPPDSVYAVIGGDGHVRIGSVDKNSKALMVEVFNAGEIFGEIGTIDDGPRTASAIAEGRVRLYKIRASSFQAAMAQSPALGIAVCGMMAKRLRRTFALYQDATFETLEVRLARQVLYLMDREGRQTQEGLRLGHRLRQADLADLLGATTRSIITILNAWRAAGLVSYDTEQARLTVRKIDALRTLVQAQ